MRNFGRSAVVVLMAIGTAILLGFTSTMTSMVVLTATALYMGGTGHPLSVPQDTPDFINSYVNGANSNYVAPSGLCGGGPGCAPVAVYTPEQFKFDTGLKDMTFDQSVAVGRANLDNCIRGNPCTVTQPPYTTTGAPKPLSDTSYVTYGYSQSATVASVEKNYLIAHPPTGKTVSFVLSSNPNRPNGGVLERFVGVYIPILGVTFNGATPTNSPQPRPLMTVDVARQYDPASDFPTNPLNLLADLNVGLGFLYLHPNYFDVGTPELQGQYQDTTYYLIPTSTLPLLMPLAQVPIIGTPLAVTLDPLLRVLVEAGYNRTINPGQPTPAQYLYFPNPIQTAINFAVAIPTGWDNGIAYITGNPANRPFHTTPQPTYGVGGPPVDAGAVDPYGAPTPYASLESAAPTFTTSRTVAAAATVRLVSTPAPSPTASSVPGDTTIPEASDQSAQTEPNASTSTSTVVKGNTPSSPVATKPTRPTIRGLIRSDPIDINALSPSDDRPVRKILNGLIGTPKARRSALADSSPRDVSRRGSSSSKDAA